MTTLTQRELEGEGALELPDREMLGLVTIKNVLNHNRLRIRVDNNNVALQVCAQVDAINTILGAQVLLCRVKQS